MTFKDNKELRSLDSKALLQEISKTQLYLNGISFDNKQGNLKNTTKLKKARRYIAAMKTYINNREETVEKNNNSNS